MQIARQIWSSSHIENCPKCKAAVQGEVVWNAWENEKNVVCHINMHGEMTYRKPDME